MAILTMLVKLAASTIGGATADCPNPVAAWTGQIGPVLTARGIAVGEDGALVLGGDFRGSADFDPGPGELIVDCQSHNSDAFVAKYASDGSPQWVYPLRSPDALVSIGGVAATENGDIWASGVFQGPIAIDASAPDQLTQTLDGYNVFLLRLGPDGTYLQHYLWQDDQGSLYFHDVEAIGDALYFTGAFFQTIDFDPGPGEDMRVSNTSRSIFVTKITKGVYDWTRTFGGSGNDRASDVQIGPDGSVLITGVFASNPADFDPGPGADFRFVQGLIEDVFVTKLTPEGAYLWTRTYPLLYPNGQGEIAIDADGSVYVAASYFESIDVDPTAGDDIIVPVGDLPDAIITKLLSDGSYGGSYVLAGSGAVSAVGVAVDGSNGSVFVTGHFKDSLDFDNGPGEQWHTSQAPWAGDGYVLSLSTDFAYQWSRTIGNQMSVFPRLLDVSPAGEVYWTGTFTTDAENAPFIDLDPGCAIAKQSSPHHSIRPTYLIKLHCPVATADHNSDGLLNLRDLAFLQYCFTGSGITECKKGCSILDLDRDDDIDLNDVELFVSMLMNK